MGFAACAVLVLPRGQLVFRHSGPARSPPTLARGTAMLSFFLHPLFLALMALAVTPIVIEWLFRRRRRRVELPTIRFLLKNPQQKKVRRQDRLLLLLRVAAIALLALAIARPLVRPSMVGQESRRNVIVLLDATASMQQQADITTSFRLAKQKAAGMVRALPAGTSVTVISLGDRVQPVLEDETDLHTTAAMLEALEPTSGSAPVSAALAWVRDFQKNKNLAAAELYVFSDFQKHTWMRPGTAVETAQLMNELPACETFLIDVGGEPQFNYVATHLEPVEPVISAGLGVKFLAEFQVVGRPPAESATVNFLIDGVKKESRDVTLTGTTPAVLEFSHRFPDAGEYLVEVVIDGDEHRIDNRRHFLCRAPQNVRVLLLDDTADAPRPESVFLARAIRPPMHPGVEKLSHFDVKTCPPLKIAYENLSEYSIVILTATRQLSESIATQLENFVGQGGSLWLFMGDEVNVFDYNRLLYKNGQGLIPCRLGKITAAPAAGSDGGELIPKYGETSHPALKLFARSTSSAEATYLKYMEFEFENPDAAAAVLTLSGGVPAIVEGRYGPRQGKVLLSNTTAGVAWNYLPALPEYPALVQELLRYLVGQPDASVNLQVGETFVQPVFVSTQQLLLKNPGGGKQRLTPQPKAGDTEQFEVTFRDTSMPGLYEFDAIEEVLPRRRFVVNPTSDEADLARLSQDEFADAFPGSATWLDRQTAVDEFAAKLHTVTELAPWVAAFLVGLLAIESWLAWRFGRRRIVHMADGSP